MLSIGKFMVGLSVLGDARVVTDIELRCSLIETLIELNWIELNGFYWLRFLIHIIYTNKEYFKSQLLQLVQNDNDNWLKLNLNQDLF